MSLFGEQLRTLVEANKINIYALAKQAGLERTAIHKIMSGGRIPSEEYVQKLADALPLSPEENRRFFDSYHISSIGEFKYKQRIQVKELIESIAQIEKDIGSRQSSKGTTPAPVGDSNAVAIGNFAVNNLVKSAISEALTNDQHQSIDFVVSEDYQYFYNELINEYIQNPQAQIRQVVTFTKKIDFGDSSNANIKLLTQILPLAFVSGAGYHPHYIYKANSDIELTQAMPYFIITSSEKLVLINKEFSRAALICDKDIVDIYSENFEVMLSRSKPLIKGFDSAFETLEYTINVYTQSLDEPFHWIEPEPCIGALFTEEMIDFILKKEIPNRDILKKMAIKHYSFIRENLLRNINVCTAVGASRLIDTGISYYVPKEIVNPIPKPKMKDLLIKLQKRAVDKKVKVLFSNPSMITLPGNTLLAISRVTGINFIMSMCEDSQPSKYMCINISEDSINEAFVDFIESIEESGLVYNEDESTNTLTKIINDIEE